MKLELQPFVDHAGQRFPIDLVLHGRKDVDDDLRTVTEIKMTGEGFAQLSTLYLDLHLAAKIRQPCRRCLQQVVTTEELDEAFEVAIQPGVEAVDLWPDVVRLVLSAHDPNVLCKPDCLGLCPICGTDLNREPNHKCDDDEDDEPRTLRDLAAWLTDS